MTIGKTSLIIIILLLSSCAGTAIAPFPFARWGWDSSEKKIIDDRYLLLSGVVVGKSTFDDVAKIFGKSKIYRSGAKNYSPNLVCYKSEHDDASVVFQSGPLGGWSVVTAVWVGKTNLIDATRCAKSRLVDRKKMAPNGLSLDLTIADIQKRIGRPTFRNAQFVAYRYQDKIVLVEGKIFDVTSGFEIQFENNKLNWFRIYRQISN